MTSKVVNCKQKEQTTSKKERNRLKAIGIMAYILAEFSDKYKNGNEISSKGIKDDILVWAEEHGIDPIGLSIFERVLADGLQYIKDKITS